MENATQRKHQSSIVMSISRRKLTERRKRQIEEVGGHRRAARQSDRKTDKNCGAASVGEYNRVIYYYRQS